MEGKDEVLGDQGDDTEEGGNEAVCGLESDGFDREGWLVNEVFTVGRPAGDQDLE